MTNTLNLDPSEVEKFEALAPRWWDTGGESKPLHDINPIRLNYINDYAAIKGKSVVDIGCGGGILSESMARIGAEVTAIDASAAAISVAKLHSLESGLTISYQQQTAEELAADAAEKFDVVTCMELLEHVPSPGSLIKACATLVKPGGHLFFSTINRTAKAYALTIIGAEYLLGILPKGTHDYARFIKPAELDRWTRNAGLNTERIVGMGYQPLDRSFRLSRNVDVNYITHCTKTE